MLFFSLYIIIIQNETTQMSSLNKQLKTDNLSMYTIICWLYLWMENIHEYLIEPSYYSMVKLLQFTNCYQINRLWVSDIYMYIYIYTHNYLYIICIGYNTAWGFVKPNTRGQYHGWGKHVYQFCMRNMWLSGCCGVCAHCAGFLCDLLRLVSSFFCLLPSETQ